MDAAASPRSMTETLTPHEAARVLTDAAGFERALERRTAGLTMMTWGLAASAIFLAYALADVLGATSPVVFGTLWMPWVAFGVAMTFALWRSAALSATRPAQDATRGAWWRTFAFIAGVTLVFAFARPEGPTLPLAILGAAYVLVAAIDLFRAHPEERGLTAAAGAALVAVAGILTLTGAPIEVSGSVSILAPLVILGGLGLYQTMRG